MNEQSVFDLTAALAEAMKAIVDKWGDVSTPLGSIWHVYSLNGTSYGMNGERSITLTPGDGDKYYPTDVFNRTLGVTDVVSIADKVGAIALYLASDDFSRKVAGSIRMLKAIYTAIEVKDITGKLFDQGNTHRMHDTPVPSRYYLIIGDRKLRRCTADEYAAVSIRAYERVSISGVSHYSISGYGPYITGQQAEVEFHRIQKFPVE